MIYTIAIPEERMKIFKKNELKKKIEDLTNVKIETNGEIKIEGDFFQTIRVKEVISAFGRGFDFEDALKLLDESYCVEIKNLKEYAKSENRMKTLKGRVIGREGKIKKIIERETDTKISIYGKTISILGKIENVNIAKKAIEMILEGRKFGSALRFLEEKRII